MLDIMTQLLGSSGAGDTYNQALEGFANIETPEIADMKLALEQYQLTGQMTPEMQQAISLGQSAMEGVSTDPRLKASQMQALEQMSGLANGQPSAADTAGFELARQNVAGEMTARNASILQDMQQRGQAGQGAELLAKLKNNQNGTDMLQKQQLEQAQAMQKARMDALSQQSNMASNVRNQDYTEQSNLAQAKDAISKFNAANSQNVQANNVNAKNQAQLTNLTNKQNLNNSNVDIANKQQTANKGLQQSNFDNKLKLEGAKAGVYGNIANNQSQEHANNANMMGNLIQTGATVGMMMSDVNAKHDVKSADNDIQDLMNKIQSYTYDYNDEKHGQGKQMGILAQDLEKSHAGKTLVEEGPEGKMVDSKKAALVALAGISNINKRLNNLEGK